MSATMKADQPPRVSSGAGAGNWMEEEGVVVVMFCLDPLSQRYAL
jgi:hypothetical protein